MITTQKIRLLKNSFPETWVRKIPLLLFPADTIKKNGRVVAICTTFRKRIILLCTDKKYRGQGLASKLIQRSGAVKTDTYFGNEKALRVWIKNGFRIKKIVNGLFGKKYILVKKK